MAKADLTAARLRELLDYNPSSGVFVWRVTRGRTAHVGTVAGSTNNGYIAVMIDGQSHRAHRLAFLFVRGAWSTGDVDHINGVRSDNRWGNLREVSHRENTQNRRFASSRSTTGVLGVCAHSDPKKPFRARIRVMGKNLSLGCFETAEEAHLVYLEAKRRLHIGCTI